MNSKKELAIVIPVYNQIYYTKKLWRSIEEHKCTTFDRIHVVFVDNGSTDGTFNWLTEATLLNDTPSEKQIIMYGVILDYNTGYGPGVNRGIKEVFDRLGPMDILVMNNDMELLPDCIDRLYAAAYSDDKIAIVGGKLLFPDGRIQHAGAFLNQLGWGQHKGGGTQEAAYADVSHISDQEYVTGALFYVKYSFLSQLKDNVCFDEIYAPAYFEEVDTCYAAHRMGYRVVYTPYARAIHYENVTGKEIYNDVVNIKKQTSDINQLKFYNKQDVLGYMPPDTFEDKLLISSKIYGTWSFCGVMRNLAKGLSRAGVDVSIAPEEYHENRGIMPDYEIKHMILKPNDYWNRYVLRSSEGDHMYLMPPGKKRIAHTTGESSHVNSLWLKQLDHVDLVLTTSNFYKDTLIANGLKTPVEVLPNSVDISLYNPAISKIDNIIEKRSLNFVSVFHFGDRKAPDILLKAFMLAFNEDDDVTLTLHTPGIKENLAGRGLSVKEYLNSLHTCNKRAPIYVTTGYVHDFYMPRFLKAFDVMVLPTRGEGFGLPILEAAAVGVPSIVTNYSGVLDIVDDNTGWKIDYDLIDIPLQYLPYFTNYVGGKWADARIDHLVEIFRSIYRGSKTDILDKGNNAAVKALDFSIENVGVLGKQLIFGN